MSPCTCASSRSLPMFVRSPPKMTRSASEAFASATAIRKSESCTLPGVTCISVKKTVRSVSAGGASVSRVRHMQPYKSMNGFFMVSEQFYPYKVRI